MLSGADTLVALRSPTGPVKAGRRRLEEVALTGQGKGAPGSPGECGIMVRMIEDEELREHTEPWPDEAQRTAAVAAFEAWEEEWRRERD